MKRSTRERQVVPQVQFRIKMCSIFMEEDVGFARVAAATKGGAYIFGVGKGLYHALAV